MRGYGALFPGYEYTKSTWTQPSRNTSHNRTSGKAFPLGLRERLLGTSGILRGGRNNARVSGLGLRVFFFSHRDSTCSFKHDTFGKIDTLGYSTVPTHLRRI